MINPSTFALRVLALTVALGCCGHSANAAGFQGERRFETISQEAAREIIRGTIARLVTFPTQWAAPESGFYARGVRLKAGGDGNIAFAAARSGFKTIVRPDGSVTPMFFDNGLLVTTIDLTYEATEPRTLPKGTYEWSISASGILLSSTPLPAQQIIIDFATPLEKFDSQTLYAVDLVVRDGDDARFVAAVAGRTLTFR